MESDHSTRQNTPDMEPLIAPLADLLAGLGLEDTDDPVLLDLSRRLLELFDPGYPKG
jgi:hypothetical protein